MLRKNRLPHVLFLSCLFLAGLLPAGSPAGAEEFFPSGGDGFFDQGARQAPTPSTRPLPGQSPQTSAAVQKFYAFCMDAGIESTGGINAPSTANLGLEWAPVPHLGLGFSVGLLMDGLVGVGAPHHSNWDYYDDYLVAADDNNWDAYDYFYQIAPYGSLPVLGLDLSLAWYPGRNGLKGFFVGNDFGLFIALADPTYYLDWEYEVPVESADGGAADLPHHQKVNPKLTPNLGYKLILAGFMLETKLGYRITSLGTGNGAIIAVNLGYALGGRRK